jgi:hypothetical protein
MSASSSRSSGGRPDVEGDVEQRDTPEPDDHTPLVERFMQRVTVDLDGTDYPTFQAFRLRATRIWHNLQDAADRVDVHVSTGQEGLHFVAWFEADVPFHDQIRLRREHGDDPRRIDMDCQRWLQLGGRFSDVLFHSKGDRENVKERRFRDVYDALDYIEARRDDGDRMNRLANAGHKGDPELARRVD